LVRWNGDGETQLGTVKQLERGGKQVAVQLDSGEQHTFVWPSEVIERIVFGAGEHVELRPDGGVGVVSGLSEHDGIVLYEVSMADGTKRTASEDGVRPAVITDPLELVRRGDLHSARSTNLRLSATRLLYAYRHDELSTLGNSRVEIKPHQVGVVH